LNGPPSLDLLNLLWAEKETLDTYLYAIRPVVFPLGHTYTPIPFTVLIRACHLGPSFVILGFVCVTLFRFRTFFIKLSLSLLSDSLRRPDVKHLLPRCDGTYLACGYVREPRDNHYRPHAAKFKERLKSRTAKAVSFCCSKLGKRFRQFRISIFTYISESKSLSKSP
jgi:hypothetical protein